MAKQSLGYIGAAGGRGGGGGGNVTTLGLTPNFLPKADSPTNLRDSPISAIANNIIMGNAGNINTVFPFHLVSQGAPPTILPFPQLGVGGTCNITGNDISGIIQLNFTRVSGPGTVAEITFNATYVSRPIVLLCLGTDTDNIFLTGFVFLNASTITPNKFAIDSSTLFATSGVGTIDFTYFVFGR